MKNNLRLVIFSLVLCSSAVFALSSVSSQQEETAKQLFATAHIDKNIASVQAAVSKKLSLEHQEIAGWILRKYFSYNQLQPIYVQAYTKYLTIEDMKYLIKIYSDPVMQTYLLKKNPLIIDDIQLLMKQYDKKIASDMKKDFDNALEQELQKQSLTGDTVKEYMLGTYYLDKKPANNELALKWLSKAANSGHVFAMNNLAIIYSEGKGVNKNQQEAIRWYKQASQGGDRSAMFNLGLRYFYGVGVGRDYQKALELFKASAYRNDVYAQFMLAKCYLMGVGAEKDKEQGKNWLILVASRFYESRFRDDDIEKKNMYIDAFLTYQMSKILETTAIYGKNISDDMIKKAKIISQDIEKVCSISSHV